MKTGPRMFALLTIMVSSFAAQSAFAQEASDEPRFAPPFYIRGLIGVAAHSPRSATIYPSGGFNVGGEIGYEIVKFKNNEEISGLVLGVSFQQYRAQFDGSQNQYRTIMGQILLQKVDEYVAYFGPEFGVANLEIGVDGTGTTTAMGVAAGVGFFVTPHFTLGPALHMDYLRKAALTSPSGLVPESLHGLVYKVLLAATYRI